MNCFNEPWPWLKVLISCRPETWQTIKKGIKLAEAFYYKSEEKDTVEIELTPFSYSERIEPFSRQELPEVYAKYAQIFKLQTKYEELNHEIKEILKDPLNLLLVAQTVSTKYNGIIHSNIKLTYLINQYLDALVNSERLQKQALDFLENQIVPPVCERSNLFKRNSHH